VHRRGVARRTDRPIDRKSLAVAATVAIVAAIEIAGPEYSSFSPHRARKIPGPIVTGDSIVTRDCRSAFTRLRRRGIRARSPSAPIHAACDTRYAPRRRFSFVAGLVSGSRDFPASRCESGVMRASERALVAPHRATSVSSYGHGPPEPLAIRDDGKSVSREHRLHQSRTLP